jgi:hypothetical protein
MCSIIAQPFSAFCNAFWSSNLFLNESYYMAWRGRNLMALDQDLSWMLNNVSHCHFCNQAAVWTGLQGRSITAMIIRPDIFI